MRSRVAFVVVALVLAAGAWWAIASMGSGAAGTSARTPSAAGDRAAKAGSRPSPLEARSAPPGAGDDKPASSPMAPSTLVLRGRLLGRDGKPLSGARVRAVGVRAARNASAGATATTDADGAFSIAGLAPGDYELWTDDGTGERLAKTNAAAGGDPIELTRTDPPPKGTLAIRGRLLDGEGKPIAGARVRAVDTHPWPGAGPRPGVLTEKDGTFAILDLPSEHYQIWANDEGGERVAAWFASAGLAPADLRPLKIDAPTDPSTGPKVVVLDADGRPVPRADVLIRMGGVGSFVTVKDGAFVRRPSDAGLGYEIFAARTAEGAPLAAGPALYVPGASGSEETVRLPVGKAIEGRVAGPDGSGVFGVELTATPKPEGEAASRPSMPRVHGRATTGSDGRFTLLGLGGGTYRVTATPLPPFLVPPAVEAVAGSSGLDIRLVKGLEAEVHVVDPDGKPVAAASVSVRATSGAPGSARGTLPQVSDANGVVAFSQLDPATTYALSATAIGRDDVGPRDVNPWTVGPTTVTLPRAWRLHGVVKRPEGATGTVVVLRRGADGKWGFATTAKKDGTFSIATLDAGPWTLAAASSIAGPNGPEVDVTDPSSEIALTLEAPAK